MIKHVVIWQLAPQTDMAVVKSIRHDLAALVGVIPGLVDLFTGVDHQGENALTLVSTHASWQALTDYQQHPAHLAIVPRVRAITTERRAVDFALDV